MPTLGRHCHSLRRLTVCRWAGSHPMPRQPAAVRHSRRWYRHRRRRLRPQHNAAASAVPACVTVRWLSGAFEGLAVAAAALHARPPLNVERGKYSSRSPGATTQSACAYSNQWGRRRGRASTRIFRILPHRALLILPIPPRPLCLEVAVAGASPLSFRARTGGTWRHAVQSTARR